MKFAGLFLVAFGLPSVFVSGVHAQQSHLFQYVLRGDFRDSNDAVIPGLRLDFDSKHGWYTDINGEFSYSLPAGDFTLTVSDVAPADFRAFLRIREDGLNPNFLSFTIDADAIKCGKAEYPKVIKSQIPQYPPAARAVRAMGEVGIGVEIGKDGTVASAKPLWGHPLLRAAARVAAEKFLFEPSNGSNNRKATLVFVFLDCAEEKSNVARYVCPYRIPVNQVFEIDITRDAQTR